MDFSKLNGLIPAVIQDDASGDVLMVGFMNAEALALTRETGYATFFSRSRNTLWRKGETSGNRLAVIALFTDCDDDTVVVKVRCEGDGNVCHLRRRSCFVPMAAGASASPMAAEASASPMEAEASASARGGAR